MTKSNISKHVDADSASNQEKQRYEKPMILSSETLEVIAASCRPGKTPQGDPSGQCGTSQLS